MIDNITETKKLNIELKKAKSKNKFLLVLVAVLIITEGFFVGFFYGYYTDQEQKINLILESDDVPVKIKEKIRK